LEREVHDDSELEFAMSLSLCFLLDSSARVQEVTQQEEEGSEGGQGGILVLYSLRRVVGHPPSKVILDDRLG
jgi:hypothetical protein